MRFYRVMYIVFLDIIVKFFVIYYKWVLGYRREWLFFGVFWKWDIVENFRKYFIRNSNFFGKCRRFGCGKK